MKKLIAVQQALKAPKNQRNTFGNYNYRSCEDILEAVKPLLAQNGLVLIIQDEIINLGERYYVKATATIYDDEGKQVASTSALAREEENKKGMDASQITGATSSYARKYALNGLFCIDDTKDADAQEIRKEPTQDEEEIFLKMLSIDNLAELNKFYGEHKTKVADRDRLNKAYANRAKAIKNGNN